MDILEDMTPGGLWLQLNENYTSVIGAHLPANEPSEDGRLTIM